MLRFLDRNFSGESIQSGQIVSLAIPVLIDQSFILGLNMFNTAMISSSGVTAVSAVNMVDSLNVLLLNVLIAVATGGTVVVAQYQGSQNPEMVSRSTEQTVFAVPVFGAVMAVLLIVLRDPTLLLLFGSAERGVFANARIYLPGSALSYPAFGFYQACCCCLRGVGKTKPALILSMITNLSYVALNILLIQILHLGVTGMSAALNLARLTGAICSFFFLTRFDHSFCFEWKNALKPNLSIQKRILFIGLPFAAEQIFFNGGKLLTQTFIVQLGTMALTANAIAWSFVLILQIPCNTVSIVSVTVVGQCMGHRLIGDARKFIRSFLILSDVSLALFLLVITPLLPKLILLFSPPPQVVPQVMSAVLLTPLPQPVFWSPSFIIPAAIRAAGDAKYTSAVSLVCMWGVRVFGGWFLTLPMGMGLVGIYLAMVVEWAVRSVIFLIRLKGKKWYAHHVID